MRRLLKESKATLRVMTPRVVAWLKRQDVFSTGGDFPDIEPELRELLGSMMQAGATDMIGQVAELQATVPRPRSRSRTSKVRQFGDWVNVLPDDALQWLDAYTPRLVGVLETALLEKCRDGIAEGLRKGLTHDEVMSLLQPSFETFSKARLETIARTESMRAYNLGTLMGLKKSHGVAGVEFFAVMDERVTPQCESRHGMQLRLDDPHIINNTPPLHPRCRSILIPILYDEVSKDWEGESGRAARLELEHPGIQRPIDIAAVRKIWNAAETVAIDAPLRKAIEDLLAHVRPDDTYLEEYKKYLKAVQNDFSDAEWATYHKNVDRIPKELEQLFASDKSQIVTRIKSSNLSKVLEDGRLKSQFETSTSGGLLDHDVRGLFEKGIFNYERSMDPKLRPIYGQIMDASDVNPFGLTHYGDAMIVYKQEIKGHATFTLGDSLNNWFHPKQLATPVLKPQIESIKATTLARGDFGAKSISRAVFSSDESYCEVQIHNGAARLENIEKVLFSKMPPPPLIAKLDKLRIPWKLCDESY